MRGEELAQPGTVGVIADHGDQGGRHTEHGQADGHVEGGAAGELQAGPRAQHLVDECVADHDHPVLLSQALLSQALLSQALLSQALLSQALLSQALLSQVLLSQVLLSQALLSHSHSPLPLPTTLSHQA
ncbi:hypothetical protein E3N94_07925 [Cryobacterium sp. Sr3]|nr:hypothetical protein E3N94_07925 [Cryobacterium sp. Sr3]